MARFIENRYLDAFLFILRKLVVRVICIQVIEREFELDMIPLIIKLYEAINFIAALITLSLDFVSINVN